VRNRAPATVWLASTLVAIYGLVLAGEGISLGIASLSGGTPSDPHPDLLAMRGMIWLAVVLLASAVLLGFAAVRFVRAGRALLFVLPLGLLVVIGLIGETVDIVGGSGLTDNLIGAGIVVLAAVPVVLAYVPSSAAWKGE
jgi:hypothetical protein